MKDIERNLGEQPIAGIMAEHQLKPNDLVTHSSEHITHKMVSRATKGRRLTPNTKGKILRALNKTIGEDSFAMADIFNY